MKKVLLLALLFAVALPAVARADTTDFTRAITGFGTVHVDGVADCSSAGTIRRTRRSRAPRSTASTSTPARPTTSARPAR
jgi:hypothetical protein